MIVKCEECKSEFNLDKALIKKSGSKVRCSVCENLFTVYPPEPDHEAEDDFFKDEALKETVALDSPFGPEESEPGQGDEETGRAFEKAFEDALEDDSIDDIAGEDLSGPDDGSYFPVDLNDGEAGVIEEFEDDPGRRHIARSKKGRGSKPVLLAVLSVILIAIIIFLLLFFMAPGLLPDVFSSLKPVNKDAVLDTGVRRLSFKDVNGVFAQSNRAGQLFIIKGSIVNGDIVNRSYILLKGVILDEKGGPVKRRLAYAGNIFTDRDILSMSIEEIEDGLKNREGKGGININVAPGGSVPFMIVFADLPENITEFMVEAVSSSPAE